MANSFDDGDDYSSEFEPSAKRRREYKADKNEEIIDTRTGGRPVLTAIPKKQFAVEEYDRAERARVRETMHLGFNQYQRHKRYINDFVLWYGQGMIHPSPLRVTEY
eukprot:m.282065 g.282065  ORF g.282065 m.282065 type:complete len:106 (-) comp16336_c0_seq27:4933-5250(-)